MLALEKGSVKFNNKTINVNAPYETNISATKTKIVLSLHYNKQNSYIFANGDKIIDFTARDSEINNDPICLGNISKDFSESDTKKKKKTKTGLYGSVYYFSIDYRPTSVDNILKTHKYVMNEYLIK